MKNYSFSNLSNQDSFAARKNNEFTNYYRHSQLKSSQTNQKIQQIKKKYDTPSRRQRLQSLKKSTNYDTGSRLLNKQQAKQNIYDHKAMPSFGNIPQKEIVSSTRFDRNIQKDIQNKQYNNPKFQPKDHRRSYQFRQSQPLSIKNMNIKEQQESIFTKMRQMKESLVNNDYMKRSTNMGKSTLNTAKYNDDKNGNKKQYDPRVQNIDKINSKIKQILSCLSQNQKQQSTYTPSYKQNSYLNRDSHSRAPSFNYQSSFTRDNRQNKDSSKSSAFFGINNVNFKEISQSKKSYQSNHFHRGGSDILQKIDVFDPTGRQSMKTDKFPQSSSKHQTKSISKSIIDYQHPRNRDYSITRLQTQKPVYQNKQVDINKTPAHNYVNRQYSQIKGLRVSQSKSQIQSVRKSILTSKDENNLNNGILKSGKKLNDQITRIQKKIQDFESQKRKLNIQFTPFSSKHNKSQNNLNSVSIRQKNVSDYSQQTRVQNDQTRTLSRNTTTNRSSSYDIKLKSYMNRASLYQQKINQLKQNNKMDKDEYPVKSVINAPNYPFNYKQIVNQRINRPRQSSEFQLKLKQIQVKTVRIEKESQENNMKELQPQHYNTNTRHQDNYSTSRIKQRRQSNIDQQLIRKRTDEGMQQRKKRLMSSENIIKTQTIKKMVALFCQQVKLDENFRNLKIWLQGQFKKDKFDVLSTMLEKEGIKMTNKQCQKLFSVDQSQNNPFFSTQNFDGSYQLLIKSYLQCQNHWKNDICHKFDKKSLLNQGFASHRIDLQKKGYIQLEDLVRFLNIESGTFYRNRDLFLIFNRFSNAQKMNFDQIIEQISA